MTGKQIVIVVDDDVDVRESLRALLESSDYSVRVYSTAKAFLAEKQPLDACVVVDIRMPEMDGLEMQEEMNRRGIEMAVIVMTGHGDVPLAVRAMKAGAIDFLEKPFEEATILTSVERALRLAGQRRDQSAEARAAQELLSLLTPREKNVLEQLVAGRSNKVAAYELGISPRTIEIHRARIMDKMQAGSLSDLVRISLAASRGNAPSNGLHA